MMGLFQLDSTNKAEGEDENLTPLEKATRKPAEEREEAAKKEPAEEEKPFERRREKFAVKEAEKKIEKELKKERVSKPFPKKIFIALFAVVLISILAVNYFYHPLIPTVTAPKAEEEAETFAEAPLEEVETFKAIKYNYAMLDEPDLKVAKFVSIDENYHTEVLDIAKKKGEEDYFLVYVPKDIAEDISELEIDTFGGDYEVINPDPVILFKAAVEANRARITVSGRERSENQETFVIQFDSQLTEAQKQELKGFFDKLAVAQPNKEELKRIQDLLKNKSDSEKLEFLEKYSQDAVGKLKKPEETEGFSRTKAIFSKVRDPQREVLNLQKEVKIEYSVLTPQREIEYYVANWLDNEQIKKLKGFGVVADPDAAKFPKPSVKIDDYLKGYVSYEWGKEEAEPYSLKLKIDFLPSLKRYGWVSVLGREGYITLEYPAGYLGGKPQPRIKLILEPDSRVDSLDFAVSNKEPVYFKSFDSQRVPRKPFFFVNNYPFDLNLAYNNRKIIVPKNSSFSGLAHIQYDILKENEPFSLGDFRNTLYVSSIDYFARGESVGLSWRPYIKNKYSADVKPVEAASYSVYRFVPSIDAPQGKNFQLLGTTTAEKFFIDSKDNAAIPSSATRYYRLVAEYPDKSTDTSTISFTVDQGVSTQSLALDIFIGRVAFPFKRIQVNRVSIIPQRGVEKESPEYDKLTSLYSSDAVSDTVYSPETISWNDCLDNFCASPALIGALTAFETKFNDYLSILLEEDNYLGYQKTFGTGAFSLQMVFKVASLPSDFEYPEFFKEKLDFKPGTINAVELSYDFSSGEKQVKTVEINSADERLKQDLKGQFLFAGTEGLISDKEENKIYTLPQRFTPDNSCWIGSFADKIKKAIFKDSDEENSILGSVKQEMVCSGQSHPLQHSFVSEDLVNSTCTKLKRFYGSFVTYFPIKDYTHDTFYTGFTGTGGGCIYQYSELEKLPVIETVFAEGAGAVAGEQGKTTTLKESVGEIVNTVDPYTWGQEQLVFWLLDPSSGTTDSGEGTVDEAASKRVLSFLEAVEVFNNRITENQLNENDIADQRAGFLSECDEFYGIFKENEVLNARYFSAVDKVCKSLKTDVSKVDPQVLSAVVDVSLRSGSLDFTTAKPEDYVYTEKEDASIIKVGSRYQILLSGSFRKSLESSVKLEGVILGTTAKQGIRLGGEPVAPDSVTPKKIVPSAAADKEISKDSSLVPLGYSFVFSNSELAGVSAVLEAKRDDPAAAEAAMSGICAYSENYSASLPGKFSGAEGAESNLDLPASEKSVYLAEPLVLALKGQRLKGAANEILAAFKYVRAVRDGVVVHQAIDEYLEIVAKKEPILAGRMRAAIEKVNKGLAKEGIGSLVTRDMVAGAKVLSKYLPPLGKEAKTEKGEKAREFIYALLNDKSYGEVLQAGEIKLSEADLLRFVEKRASGELSFIRINSFLRRASAVAGPEEVERYLDVVGELDDALNWKGFYAGIASKDHISAVLRLQKLAKENPQVGHLIQNLRAGAGYTQATGEVAYYFSSEELYQFVKRVENGDITLDTLESFLNGVDAQAVSEYRSAAGNIFDALSQNNIVWRSKSVVAGELVRLKLNTADDVEKALSYLSDYTDFIPAESQWRSIAIMNEWRARKGDLKGFADEFGEELNQIYARTVKNKADAGVFQGSFGTQISDPAFGITRVTNQPVARSFAERPTLADTIDFSAPIFSAGDDVELPSAQAVTRPITQALKTSELIAETYAAQLRALEEDLLKLDYAYREDLSIRPAAKLVEGVEQPFVEGRALSDRAFATSALKAVNGEMPSVQAGEKLRVISFSLDNFKSYNSTFGNTVVDERVLPELVATVKDNLNARGISVVEDSEIGAKIVGHRYGDNLLILVKDISGNDAEFAKAVSQATDEAALSFWKNITDIPNELTGKTPQLMPSHVTVRAGISGQIRVAAGSAVPEAGAETVILHSLDEVFDAVDEASEANEIARIQRAALLEKQGASEDDLRRAWGRLYDSLSAAERKGLVDAASSGYPSLDIAIPPVSRKLLNPLYEEAREKGVTTWENVSGTWGRLAKVEVEGVEEPVSLRGSLGFRAAERKLPDWDRRMAALQSELDELKKFIEANRVKAMSEEELERFDGAIAKRLVSIHAGKRELAMIAYSDAYGNLISKDLAEFVIDSYRAQGKGVSAFKLDFDNFRKFSKLENIEFPDNVVRSGEAVGDQVIKDSFDIMSRTVEEEGGKVVRAGTASDEAYWIIPRELSDDEAKALYKTINQRLADYSNSFPKGALTVEETPGIKVPPKVSCGYSSASAGSEVSTKALLREAEMAKDSLEVKGDIKSFAEARTALAGQGQSVPERLAITYDPEQNRAYILDRTKGVDGEGDISKLTEAAKPKKATEEVAVLEKGKILSALDWMYAKAGKLSAQLVKGGRIARFTSKPVNLFKKLVWIVRLPWQLGHQLRLGYAAKLAQIEKATPKVGKVLRIGGGVLSKVTVVVGVVEGIYSVGRWIISSSVSDAKEKLKYPSRSVEVSADFGKEPYVYIKSGVFPIKEKPVIQEDQIILFQAGLKDAEKKYIDLMLTFTQPSFSAPINAFSLAHGGQKINLAEPGSDLVNTYETQGGLNIFTPESGHLLYDICGGKDGYSDDCYKPYYQPKQKAFSDIVSAKKSGKYFIVEENGVEIKKDDTGNYGSAMKSEDIISDGAYILRDVKKIYSREFNKTKEEIEKSKCNIDQTCPEIGIILTFRMNYKVRTVEERPYHGTTTSEWSKGSDSFTTSRFETPGLTALISPKVVESVQRRNNLSRAFESYLAGIISFEELRKEIRSFLDYFESEYMVSGINAVVVEEFSLEEISVFKISYNKAELGADKANSFILVDSEDQSDYWYIWDCTKNPGMSWVGKALNWAFCTEGKLKNNLGIYTS